MHTHTHAHTHTCQHTHEHAYTHMHTHTHTHTHTRTCTCTRTKLETHGQYTFAQHIHLCTYVYTHTHTLVHTQFSCCGWNNASDWLTTPYYNSSQMFPGSCNCTSDTEGSGEGPCVTINFVSVYRRVCSNSTTELLVVASQPASLPSALARGE